MLGASAIDLSAKQSKSETLRDKEYRTKFYNHYLEEQNHNNGDFNDWFMAAKVPRISTSSSSALRG